MSDALALRNRQDRYGLVAIFLHWIVAAAFIANFAIVYAMKWFMVPRSEEARAMLSYHTAIGVSVLVFVALRLFWKWSNRTPDDVPGTRLEHFLAHAMHHALYLVMIILPLSGYLGTGGPSQLFFVVEIPRFADTAVFQTVVNGWMGLSWEAFEAPMDVIHKQGGAYVVSVLIAAHAAAALYHHFVRRDNVLRRMISPALVKPD
ncbi:cytochrome b [Granulosicoccaceae sp. 1_MG-2023]|nr:cytochrome b [Granulosicoccaceae sp. 1_MG-2023]